MFWFVFRMQCVGRGLSRWNSFFPFNLLFLCTDRPRALVSPNTLQWLTSPVFQLLQENQAPQTPTATVDAPGRAMAAAAPSAELQPSGTTLSSLAVVAAPCRLAMGVGVPLRTLRRTLSWTCHQVAHNPLDSPFLCTYCIYLFCCFTINVLLDLL